MATALQNWKNKLSDYVSVRVRDDDTSDISSSKAAVPASGSWKEKLKVSNFKSFRKDGWILEVLCAIASALAFIAIIAVLGYYDGRPVTLLPRGITLNGIVSILATVSKAALMSSIAATIGQCRWLQYANSRPNRLQNLQVLDDASRGPRGSIMLLLGGMRTIAVLGAILTIIAVGFDPSVQLLIHTDVRSVFADDTGANLVNVLSLNDTDYYTDGLSLAYRDAVISALSDNAPSFDMSPACPSKNCTWPEYRNLRLYSYCTDITQWMTDQSGGPNTFCQTTCPYQTDLGNGTLVDDCAGMDETDTSCQYPMPAPFENFTGGYSDLGNTNIDAPILFSSALPGYEVVNTDAASVLNQPHEQYPLVVVATARNLMMEPSGFLCSLSFRLDTLNSTVKDGVASTQVLESMSLSNISRLDLPQDETDAVLHFTPDTDDTAGVSKGPGRDLQIYYWMYELLNMSLPEYFTGNLTEDDSYSHVQYSFSPAPGYEIMDGMDRTNDFSAMMDRVAASMSKRMRDVGGKLLTGESGHMETYFKINWAWITLPAIVLIGGIAFVAVVIFETRRLKVNIWKSSTLPLMYSASECDLKSDSDPATLSQMERLAKKTTVRLHRGSSTGWAFQRASVGSNRGSLV